MSARRSSRSLTAALALLLAGCAGLPAPSPAPLPPEVHRLLDAMDRRWQQFEDLRTRAEITVHRGRQVERLSGVLLLKSPDSLRLEALSPWGQPFLVITAGGGSFTLYHVGENRALVGPASARATERWLGFALEPRELVAILFGHVLPMKAPLTGALRPAGGSGLALELQGPREVQRIWIDAETLVVRQVEWTGEDRQLRVTYEGGGPAEPPAIVTLSAPEPALVVSIRYWNPEVGVGLPAERFTLTLPDHAKIQRFR